MTFAMGKRRREDQKQKHPPVIKKALVLRVSGASWVDYAAAVGTSATNLREWRKHPDADGFLQEVIVMLNHLFAVEEMLLKRPRLLSQDWRGNS